MTRPASSAQTAQLRFRPVHHRAARAGRARPPAAAPPRATAPSPRRRRPRPSAAATSDRPAAPTDGAAADRPPAAASSDGAVADPARRDPDAPAGHPGAGDGDLRHAHLRQRGARRRRPARGLRRRLQRGRQRQVPARPRRGRGHRRHRRHRRHRARGTGEWIVQAGLRQRGHRAPGPSTPRANIGKQVGITLDGEVISAPTINSAITGGTEISGSFDQRSATELANQLKYGALPLSFTQATAQSISTELGAEQLRAGLIAGAIGIALVFLYALIYYRLLGLVMIASLVLSAVRRLRVPRAARPRRSASP